MVTDLRPLAAVLVVAGAFVLVVGAIGGYWIRAAVARLRAPQEAVFRRELMQRCKEYERQLDAIRHAISRFKLDQRTAPNDVLFVREHVDPLLTGRVKF